MINVNGKEYDEEKMTQDQQYLVAQCKDIESGLQRLSFQADQLNAAKKVFSDALIASLTPVESEEVVETTEGK